MSKLQKTPLDLRKAPQQQRSRAMVDVVLEATARILEDGGLAAFNTNAIAERAGIGIASLYDYFPSKDAILLEFARREIRQHRTAIMDAVDAAVADSNLEPERYIIGALMNASDRRKAIRRIATQVLTQAGLDNELNESLQQLSAFIAERWSRLPRNDYDELTQERLFVLTRAVSGVLSAAVRENVDLDRMKLEEELVALARSLTRRRES